MASDAASILDCTRVRNSILACTRCGLRKVGMGPVPGTLIPTSQIAVVGEAPGKIEDVECKPFVGPAGKEARRWLEMAGLNPLDVSWVNVVCCFPNRTPTRSEVESCRPNLTAQLEAIRPQYVLVLGGVALQAMLPFDARISELHGYWWRMKFGETSAQVTATYHPSATLRNFHLLPAATLDVETFGVVVREEAEMGENGVCAWCKKADVQRVYGDLMGFCFDCAKRLKI